MINCVYCIGLSYTSPELKPRTDVRLFYLHPRLRPCGTVEQSQGTYDFKVTRYIITGVYFLTQLFTPPPSPFEIIYFSNLIGFILIRYSCYFINLLLWLDWIIKNRIRRIFFRLNRRPGLKNQEAGMGRTWNSDPQLEPLAIPTTNDLIWIITLIWSVIFRFLRS